MSQSCQCQLNGINILVSQYLDSSSFVALDILELHIANNAISIDESIREI